MSFRHVVRPGECLSSIAFDFGFEPDTVWNDAENQELREERPSFNLLAPGDVLMIPERVLHEEICATGQRHRFKRKAVPEKLRLRMMEDDLALADVPYRLTIGELVLEGRTDADGWIDEFIPPDAKRATLTLIDEETGEDRVGDQETELALGAVDPLESVDAARDRLIALGYLDIDVETAGEMIAAIREFQTDHDLERTGELDDETLDELERRYGR